MIDQYERERRRRLYGTLRYYLDIYPPMRKHELKGTDLSNVPTNLKGNNILTMIQSHRQLMKEDRELGFRRRMRSNVHEAMDTLFRTETNGTRHVTLRFGGKPEAHKYKEPYRAAQAVEVRIGWMWLWKVWKPLYVGTSLYKDVPVILQAERVRVNNNLMNVYEVIAYDFKQDQTKNGYLAVTKESRKGFFHTSASSAISAAMNSISKHMDQILTGKGKPND